MFTMMIVMAVVTTCITAPGVHLLYRGRREELLGAGGEADEGPQAQGLPTTATCTASESAVEPVDDKGLTGGGSAGGRKSDKDAAGAAMSSAV